MSVTNIGLDGTNPLVSVLIAAYNVQDSFKACTDSVIAQTYHNLEIIVVDDGSTDSTPGLCDRFAERDNRVKVVHQKNAGLSSARNAGLALAKGDYVIFIDSDDEMMPEQVERLLGLAVAEHADIAYCDWYVNEVGLSRNISPTVKVMYPDEFMPLILTDIITSHAWNKLFRRGLWDGIEFPLGRVAQDMAVMHLVFARASKVVHTSERLYLYYAGNPNNTSNTNKSKPASSIDRAYALESRYEMAKKFYPQVAEQVFGQLASFKVAAYYKALGQGDPRADSVLAWLKDNLEHVERSDIGIARRILALAAGTFLEDPAALIIARR